MGTRFDVKFSGLFRILGLFSGPCLLSSFGGKIPNFRFQKFKYYFTIVIIYLFFIR